LIRGNSKSFHLGVQSTFNRHTTLRVKYVFLYSWDAATRIQITYSKKKKKKKKKKRIPPAEPPALDRNTYIFKVYVFIKQAKYEYNPTLKVPCAPK